MKKFLRSFIVIFLFSFPNVNFAQAPDLGTLANFVFFTSTGAVSNTGISHVTGNVGTNTGAITSFGNVDGVMHSPDATTLTCVTDLASAYAALNTVTATATHSVLLGDGEILYSGVYSIPAAASINNILTLDAQGNEDAVFIFQIGGALSSGASTQIILINCAKASNIYWKVEGAVSFAAGTNMKGTIIANNAAISLGAGVILEGRAFSTTGAIAVNGVLAYLPIDSSSPILTGATAPSLASTACYALFSANGLVINNGITTVAGDIGTNAGSATGYNPLNVTGIIHPGPDLSTGTCATDLLNLYNYLNNLAYDIELLYPAQFGNSLVLTPHTYLMNGAITLTDTLFLNAEGNANAVFVIQANGPLSTSTNAKIVLINGAQARNVFWKIEGAVTINNNSDFKGTIVCNNGAIILNTGTTLEGSAFTTTGALTTTAIITTVMPAATISYAGYAYCSNAGTATVNFSGTQGGIYSSTTGLVIDPSTGAVDLAGSTPGTYIVTYSVAAAGGCSASFATASITIAVPASATISYPGSPFCSNTGMAAVTFTGSTGGIYSSTTGLIIDRSTGTIDLAGSLPGIYTIFYTISRCSGGCGPGNYVINTLVIINPNTWTGGISSDWYTAGNWAANAMPTLTCADVTILSGVPYQPILNSGTFAIQNLFINPGASLVISNAVLQVSGTINNSGSFDVSNGSIEMNGTVTQTITANTFENNAINNLINSNSSAEGVILAGPLDVYGSLIYTSTGLKLTTNDILTLKSTATGTARIGNMTGKVIEGKVTVERYIPAHKAWYFLSIPTNTTQTIKQAWQEGAVNTNSNPVIGYGTQITSNRATWSADGFDMYSATPSMKTYNPVNNSWTGIFNTNSAAISATDGYMTFIRGDRTANAFNSIPTETVLRTTGDLYNGDQVPVDISAGQFAAIGNPYASLVDMRYISKTGIKDFFYVWDPNLAGISGFGAYQTFSYNGSDYLVTPGMGSYGVTGSVSNFLQSGHAFIVQATVAGGQLRFTEAAKTDGIVVARPANIAGQELRANLYGVNPDGSTYMADGIFINYDDNYTNSIDDMDAIKSVNTGENLSIKNANNLLVIERRHSIVQQDTIFLNISGVKAHSYQFEFIAAKLAEQGTTAFLEDSYLNTKTTINLNENTIVNFIIVNVPGSYAPDRFRVVFKAAIVLPLNFTSVKAWQKNENIVVEWKTGNETNMKQYEVEKSIDGNHYTKVNTQAARNATNNNYNWLDEQMMTGNNYYRIKGIGINDETKYSSVVKVFVKELKDVSSIVVYPNPVTGNDISVQFNNVTKGNYTMQLFNAAGELTATKTIRHTETTSLETFKLDERFIAGKYELKLTGEAIELNISIIKR
ncbi:MAG: ice-binding family protein [Ferruginibacter sp.]